MDSTVVCATAGECVATAVSATDTDSGTSALSFLGWGVNAARSLGDVFAVAGRFAVRETLGTEPALRVEAAAFAGCVLLAGPLPAEEAERAGVDLVTPAVFLCVVAAVVRLGLFGSDKTIPPLQIGWQV